MSSLTLCPRPLDRQRRRLGEGVDVERAQHREVVVADQRDRAALADQGGAGVGLDPVAEHVAEAPDLLDPGLLDRLEHGLERRQVGVDVGNCGDPHAGQRTQWPAPRGQSAAAGASPYDGRDDGSSRPDRRPAQRSRRRLSRPARGRAERARADAWSGRRKPSWATTAPTRRCCWRPLWAKTRATSPPVWPTSCAPSWGRRRSSGSRSPAPASSTSSSPTIGTGGRWSASPPPASSSGRRRPTRPSASWSSSSRPTRPGRCTSAAAATPPTATPSCACLEAAGHEVQREFYVNDAGGQIERFAASIAARMKGEEPPEDGYGGDYVIEPGRADRRRGNRRRRPEGDRQPRRRADPGERARHARPLRRPLRQLVLRARPLQPRRGRGGPGAARRGGAHLPPRGGALAAHDHLRRRQGPGADPRQRRTDLPRRRRRLPLGQARAWLRPPDQHPRRRPPRLRPPRARRDRGPRRRPGALRGADHAARPHRRKRRAGADVEAQRRLRRPRRAARRHRRRRDALVHALAQPRHHGRPRPRARPPPVQRQPGLLRPVRARPDRQHPAQSRAASPTRSPPAPARRRRARRWSRPSAS